MPKRVSPGRCLGMSGARGMAIGQCPHTPDGRRWPPRLSRAAGFEPYHEDGRMPRLVPERFLAALRPSAASGPLDVTVEVARESRRRVRVAALLGAAGYAVFLLLALTRLTEATALERTIDVTHDLVGVALSLSLLLVAMLPA